MTPMRPVIPVTSDPQSPFAPPFIDEDPDNELVHQGLDEAEDEKREAVADAYEIAAIESDDPDEALDDIDYTEAEDDPKPAELDAIHEEWIPSEKDNDDL